MLKESGVWLSLLKEAKQARLGLKMEARHPFIMGGVTLNGHLGSKVIQNQD